MSHSTASLIRHDGRNGYRAREKLFVGLCLAAVLLPVLLLVGLVGQLFVEGLGLDSIEQLWTWERIGEMLETEQTLSKS